MKNVFVLLSVSILSAPIANQVTAQKIEIKKVETCKELVIRKCKEDTRQCVSLIEKMNPFSTRTGNIPKEKEIKKIIDKRIWCKIENK